ncbi:MAG: imidazole glycerol phosphate synthase subunit HisH [Spirochaetales bacterium]|nr:imidazole glycerol phosphate synthase subunit HisH [Spirochaetales bacterium]
MAVAVVDYKAGNLKSVDTALKYLKADYFVSDDPEKIILAERIIFPGVGEAKSAMDNLRETGLGDAIKQAFAAGTPVMGICLGSQIVLEHSEERNTPCLGLVGGTAKRFEPTPGFKVPHMGWNQVSPAGKSFMFRGIPANASFYFVHSYYPNPDKEYICAQTEYICTFTSALQYGNLFAVQFHPEKSGKHGLQMLNNFLEWKGNA